MDELRYDERELDDEIDIKSQFLSVHTQELKTVLSTDIILAVLDDKERKFVINSIMDAHEALYLIKDKKASQYACTRLLLKAIAVALTSRNIKGNPMAEMMLRKEQQQLIHEPNIDSQIADKTHLDTRGRK